MCPWHSARLVCFISCNGLMNRTMTTTPRWTMCWTMCFVNLYPVTLMCFGYYMVGYYAVGFSALWPFLLFITHEWRIIRIRILIPLIIRCLSRVLKLLYWIDIRMKGGVMCNQMLEKIVFVSSYFLDHYIHKWILACYLKKIIKK